MKRIINILLTCTLLVSFAGGAGFVATSCTPEEQPGGQTGTDSE